MKIRAALATLAGIGMLVTVGSPAHAASAKVTAKVFMTGDCADGEFIEGEDEDDCEITVSVSNKSKNVATVLEVAYDEEDVEWEELDSGRTKGGRIIYSIAATDDDDEWMDGVVLYRVRVKKASGVTVPKTKTYRIEFISSGSADEDDLEESDEDKAFNAEMDKAQQQNKQYVQQQQPNQDIKQGDTSTAPKTFDKTAEFNRACGAIGFPKDKCDQLVATKSAKDALTILGSQSEKWCVALVNSKEQKVTCDMVLPKVFPPLNN